MQITSTAAAVVLVATALAGGAAGAAIHAAVTARVTVECPAPTPVGGEDLRRFLAPPAPPATGGARY